MQNALPRIFRVVTFTLNHSNNHFTESGLAYVGFSDVTGATLRTESNILASAHHAGWFIAVDAPDLG
jgi:hypothetical protein